MKTKAKPPPKFSFTPRQSIFYIGTYVFFFAAFMWNLLNAVFWLLVLALFSLWISGGWISLSRDNPKTGRVKVYFTEDLVNWIAAPFQVWDQVGKSVYGQEVSYKNILIGTFVGLGLIVLTFIALVVYLAIGSPTPGASG